MRSNRQSAGATPANPAGAIRRFLFTLILLTACGPVSAPGADSVPGPVSPSPTGTGLPVAFYTLTPAITPSPTLTVTPAPTATLFPLPESDAPIVPCSKRKPAADDLLVVVNNGFGLNADYVPRDLVRLGKYLPYSVVYSDTTTVRLVIVDALVKMVRAMQAVGLKPLIRSGFRSYYDQSTARQKWEQTNPDRAGMISAKPGHSEHQLGLVVDFGSPELADLVGDPTIEFHSAFDQTSEGKWLADNAHKFGFSMSSPLGAALWTGLTYEPWHFRYVGVELATYLYDSGQFLTKFLMQTRPVLPCMP